MQNGRAVRSTTRRAIALLIFPISWTAAPCAAAPIDGAADTPCREEDPGAYRHDGFFARGDLGLAYLIASVEPRIAPANRSGIRGVGLSSEVAIGGTPGRGLVVGGSLWTSRIDPTFVENGRSISSDDDSVKVTLARIGPFVDWYPKQRRGFHVLAAGSFALQIETDVKGNPVRPAGYGAAFAVGSGYEWFVSSEFSLGFIARLGLSSVFRRPGDTNEHTLGLVPELSFSYTYH